MLYTEWEEEVIVFTLTVFTYGGTPGYPTSHGCTHITKEMQNAIESAGNYRGVLTRYIKY